MNQFRRAQLFIARRCYEATNYFSFCTKVCCVAFCVLISSAPITQTDHINVCSDWFLAWPQAVETGEFGSSSLAPNLHFCVVASAPACRSARHLRAHLLLEAV